MVVKKEKNLIHDVVMNYIPKKKNDPPKVSIEQMVKDQSKLLAESAGGSVNQKVNAAQITKNVFSEIEKKVIDVPIKISKVEPVAISDIVMSLGGEIQKKTNSRKRSRNNVKSTVEKLIDSKLKSEFIENLINNNMDKQTALHKVKSPIVSYNIEKKKINNTKMHISANNIQKTVPNNSKSPITKKFKSDTNVTTKPALLQNKEQLIQPYVNKKSNNTSDISKGGSDNKKHNRTNNYLKSTGLKNKKEAEIITKSFRDYEIKISNSRKKSKRKNSKKYKGSKKDTTRKSKNKSKNKSKEESQNIQLGKGVPNYLQIDLKQLIGNNIKINNDNFNFNKR
jgi:hypothetical protein